MMLISAHSGRSGGVTLLQVWPPSSRDVDQPVVGAGPETPAACGDSASAKIVQ